MAAWSSDMVGQSAQHGGKCNNRGRVCYQGSGASQPLWLPHKAGRGLNAC